MRAATRDHSTGAASGRSAPATGNPSHAAQIASPPPPGRAAPRTRPQPEVTNVSGKRVDQRQQRRLARKRNWPATPLRAVIGPSALLAAAQEFQYRWMSLDGWSRRRATPARTRPALRARCCYLIMEARRERPAPAPGRWWITEYAMAHSPIHHLSRTPAQSWVVCTSCCYLPSSRSNAEPQSEQSPLHAVIYLMAAPARGCE